MKISLMRAKIGMSVVGLVIIGIIGYFLIFNSENVLQSSESIDIVEEKEDKEVTESNSLPSQSIVKESVTIIQEPKPVRTPTEFELYALEKINQDRKKFRIPPVLFSDNQGAQIQANDMLTTGTLSHWMSTGEKPYMVYTRTGGSGYLSQNVAATFCTGLTCNLEPFKEINDRHYEMVYDDEGSDWGHRDNILDPTHTHVSIGVAYDSHHFFFVQNFEDNYIDFVSPIEITQENKVSINGNLLDGNIYNIAIYYDPVPTTSLYEKHKNEPFYESGDLVALVQEPPPPGALYPKVNEYELIVANKWYEREPITVEFDLSSVLKKQGVYTIGVWLENNDKQFLATTYSIFVEN